MGSNANKNAGRLTENSLSVLKTNAHSIISNEVMTTAPPPFKYKNCVRKSPVKQANPPGLEK
ncbi:hypothetical protein FACS1894181_09740 [Bacteroidia bacterium]|nr:hypothetical protein FACS1894181_09740 [Bacteroidia bacterium]